MTERNSLGIPSIKPIRISDNADIKEILLAMEAQRRDTEFWLRQLANHVDRQSGARGEPTFLNDVNANGMRIKSLAIPVAPTDAQRVDKCLHLDGDHYDAQGRQIRNVQQAFESGQAVPYEQLLKIQAQLSSTLVNTFSAQTVSGTKTFTDKATFNGEVEIDGALNHDGLTAGFFAHAPAAQVAALADATSSHSLTDPADTPATADALRDDLVANTLPSIVTALDALGVKINALIDFAQAHGLMGT